MVDESNIAELASLIEKSSHILIFMGAGISADSLRTRAVKARHTL